VLQVIAVFLPQDRDIASLSLVCREVRERVLGAESAFWRARFKAEYDLPKGRSNEELRREYQIRTIVLRQAIDFKQEKSDHQTLWIEVIQTMLIEALTLPIESSTSKNWEKIRETLTRGRFLCYLKREHPTQVYCAVQLCLTSLALDSEVTKESCGRNDYDLGAVYSFKLPINGPLIDHELLDFTPFIHIHHFWQHHLMGSSENTFYESFSTLPDEQKPKSRKSYASHAYTPCQTYWLDMIVKLGTHLSQIDIMTLEIEHEPSERVWPDECNKIIPLLGGDGMQRTYFQGEQSTLGGDPANNPVFGFTELIARPYGDIPGWTRICFAICEGSSESDETGDTDDFDSHWVHGYEGLLLPGGRIMMGRWLDLKNMDASGRGPFIFWDL
ncbi:hypothetical protein N7462_006385, partial [Penicillium macrosclerotiorum]|uniref:uncharacterized protein n=1 Tax=Penicillium macrosclerotiorum TaxID=303699 RepID=UPI0025495DAF